jgi:hypothetical protein
MSGHSRSAGLWLLSFALVSLVHASQPEARPQTAAEPRASADLLPGPSVRRLHAPASRGPVTSAVTVEAVGDVDSFGRSLRWLGVAQGDVDLAEACPVPGSAPDARCVVVSPTPALTDFDLADLASITLPARSANSLLCHWFSPVLTLQYANPGADAAVAQFSYFPTLTLENAVLLDPGLIDPTTGAPFAGRLTTGMTASERFEVPLAPGMTLNERQRDTATCIAGFISKRALIQNYGLSESQANEFFRRDTVVRLNVRGSARYVQAASLNFGLRIIGD